MSRALNTQKRHNSSSHKTATRRAAPRPSGDTGLCFILLQLLLVFGWLRQSRRAPWWETDESRSFERRILSCLLLRHPGAINMMRIYYWCYWWIYLKPSLFCCQDTGVSSLECSWVSRMSRGGVRVCVCTQRDDWRRVHREQNDCLPQIYLIVLGAQLVQSVEYHTAKR